jgi:hypothetical protein
LFVKFHGFIGVNLLVIEIESCILEMWMDR